MITTEAATGLPKAVVVLVALSLALALLAGSAGAQDTEPSTRGRSSRAPTSGLAPALTGTRWTGAPPATTCSRFERDVLGNLDRRTVTRRSTADAEKPKVMRG